MAKLLIKEMCKSQGIPLKVLAEKMGMSASVLSQFLNSPNPSIPTLERIASVLKVNLGDLFEKKYNHITGFISTDKESMVINTKEEWVKASQKVDGLVKLPLYPDILSLRKDIDKFVSEARDSKRNCAFMAQMGADLIVSIASAYHCEYDENENLEADYQDYYVNLCWGNGKVKNIFYSTLENEGDFRGLVQTMQNDIEQIYEDEEFGEDLK